MTSASQMYLLRMSDGRQFTDYTPRGCELAERKESAHESKNRMIASADSIIAADRKKAADSVGLSADGHSPLAEVPGFDTTQTCDTRSCSFVAEEGHGVGLGNSSGP